MTFESTYLPTLWALSNVEDRTTNACESFHAKFNKLFLEAHPNIFIFLRNLMDYQEENYVTIRSVHIPKKIHNTAYVRRCKNLEFHRQQFLANANGLKYVKKCSKHFSMLN